MKKAKKNTKNAVRENLFTSRMKRLNDGDGDDDIDNGQPE